MIPRLFCRDPAAEVEFCERVLGAVAINKRPRADGTLAHAVLQIGSAMVMIEAEWPQLPSRAPQPDASSPVVIFVYVPDVDAAVARALAVNAKVVVPLKDQFWGDRTAWVMDTSGHVWTIASRVEATTEEQRQARWAALSQPPSKDSL